VVILIDYYIRYACCGKAVRGGQYMDHNQLQEAYDKHKLKCSDYKKWKAERDACEED